MTARQYAPDVGWIARLLVGALVGAGIATLLSADPVSVPLLGAVPGVTAGAVAVVLGCGLYTQLPDCGCTGTEKSCDCADCGS